MNFLHILKSLGEHVYVLMEDVSEIAIVCGFWKYDTDTVIAIICQYIVQSRMSSFVIRTAVNVRLRGQNM